MLDIGKLIQLPSSGLISFCFSSMLDIGKLIHAFLAPLATVRFSSMLDIGKLIQSGFFSILFPVLAQCWI